MKQQLPLLGVRFGKIQSLLLTIAVFATLVLPAIVQIGGWSSDPTIIDNRRPAPLPGLPNSMRGVETFRDGVNKFIDDNFGLRVELVKLNVLIHSWIGVSAIPNWMVGKDGWVFLKTHNNIFDQFRGLSRFTSSELDAWIDTMERYQRWLASQGIVFIVAIAPNQQTIYPDYMPHYANRVWPETRLDQIVRRLRERKSDLIFIDPRSDLWAAREKFQLYHRYESHWNSVGSFIAYSAIMKRVGKHLAGVTALQWSDFDLRAGTRRWNIPPKREAVPVLRLKQPSNVIGTEVVATVNNVAIRKTTTRLETAATVLVYGDSFGFGLLDYFRETFKSTTFVETVHSPFPEAIIKADRPNLVIYEIVERYLLSPPANAHLELDALIRTAPPLQKMLDETGGATGGYVDAVGDDGDKVRFSGWAVNPVTKEPATVIYAYAGDRVVGAARPNHSRPEFAHAIPNVMVGFNMTAAKDSVAQAPERRLRFFGLYANNKVFELNLYAPVLPQLDALVGRP